MEFHDDVTKLKNEITRLKSSLEYYEGAAKKYRALAEAQCKKTFVEASKEEGQPVLPLGKVCAAVRTWARALHEAARRENSPKDRMEFLSGL